MNPLIKSLALAAVAAATGLPVVAAETQESRCYEMRTYHAAPGKFNDLHARFRNHTVKLFEKHGMVNLGYWVPMDEKDGAADTLIYVLAYPSREAREKSWKGFMSDPDWQAAYKASEVNGRLVAKIETQFLQATDYSPPIKPVVTGEPRVFELRTYTASPGNLGHLNARFRDHTVKLFEKHGIANVAYWTPAPKESGADDTLVYILSHKSREAAAASFGTFRTDPAWLAARKQSEEKAGGSLTTQGGVKSVFMTATDYSPLR
ncbi:MAG: NIPSNAP family protein [Verrucomicrobia bacterium]|nr:NIPSNAP family protein [Verrucomicrobiota bacterium]